MSTSAELIAALRERTADTPYTVVETDKGFDLTVDVADARWLTLLKAHGTKQVFTHEVALDEARQRLTITDVASSLDWSAGGSTPRLRAERSVQRGRVYQKSFRKEYGVDADTGEAGAVVDYAFDSSEGRDLVREVAAAHGWSEAMGTEQKIGLVVGIGALVLVVLGFLVWGLVALLG